MANLVDEIRPFVVPERFDSAESYARFNAKLGRPPFTRAEDPRSHVCVYFLPYDRAAERFFFIHHKKSGKWLSPGGHVEPGESLSGALNREVAEELGVENAFGVPPEPFLLSNTDIQSDVQACREHYEVWYLFETDGTNFKVSPEEFLDSRWVSGDGAREIITDPANLAAVACIEASRKPKTPEKILEEILIEFQPVFRAHGGGAEVISAGPEVVILRLKGHCSDCALAPLTFGLGIEKLIRQRLPEVREVRYTN